MEIQAIHRREGLITTRDELSEVIEENCLDACLSLYDKNIRTVSANGNVQYAMSQSRIDNARASFFIHIDYDTLDENNKKIAEELYRNHLVDISTTDTYGGIRKKVIIRESGISKPGQRPTYNVGNFMYKCKEVVDAFVYQDVLFGRYTPDVMLKLIVLIQGITDENEIISFLLNNNLIDSNMSPNIQGILDYVQAINLPIFIMDNQSGDYKTIYLGKIYDENTNEFWVNQELLQKHNEYISNLNRDGEPDNIVPKM